MLNSERLLGMEIESAAALLKIEGLDFSLNETVAERPGQELSGKKTVIRVREISGKIELTYCKV